MWKPSEESTSKKEGAVSVVNAAGQVRCGLRTDDWNDPVRCPDGLSTGRFCGAMQAKASLEYIQKSGKGNIGVYRWPLRN